MKAYSHEINEFLLVRPHLFNIIWLVWPRVRKYIIFIIEDRYFCNWNGCLRFIEVIFKKYTIKLWSFFKCHVPIVVSFSRNKFPCPWNVYVIGTSSDKFHLYSQISEHFIIKLKIFRIIYVLLFKCITWLNSTVSVVSTAMS